MTVVKKVSTSYNEAFDIRYGRWSYWTANDNPHQDPWRGRFNDNGVLLVFDSTQERDKWLAEQPSLSAVGE